MLDVLQSRVHSVLLSRLPVVAGTAISQRAVDVFLRVLPRATRAVIKQHYIKVYESGLLSQGIPEVCKRAIEQAIKRYTVHIEGQAYAVFGGELPSSVDVVLSLESGFVYIAQQAKQK